MQNTKRQTIIIAIIVTFSLPFILCATCDFNLPGEPIIPTITPEVPTKSPMIPSQTAEIVLQIVPSETPAPVIPTAGMNMCNNPYWPLKPGATWRYTFNDYGGNEGYNRGSFGQVLKIPSNPEITDTIVLEGDTNLQILHCSAEGIRANVFNLGNLLILPAEDKFMQGKKWEEGGYQAMLTFSAIQENVVTITINDGQYQFSYSFSKGIGLTLVQAVYRESWKTCPKCDGYIWNMSNYAIP